MNSFLKRYYHWLILGVVLLVSVGTAGYLIPQFTGLKDSFTALSAATKATKSPAPPPSTNAVNALAKLTNPVIWATRDDGASPLVSRPYLLKNGGLIDPMEGTEPLYPPVPNKWLIDHQLDYTDVNILDRDPKHKGFTVKEEFAAGTDPNNANQFPPLYTKLSYSGSDISKSTYTFDFVDIDNNEGRTEFELRPLQPLPNPAKGNRPDSSPRAVAKGETIPGAPFLKVVDYQPKKKTIKETEYDVDELTLENTLTGEHYVVIKKFGSREYKPLPIEMIESVTFHYQLTGAPEETIIAQRGKEFSLSSLDKKFTEIYKLNDFSNASIILGKDGKTFTIRETSSVPIPAASPTSTP
jgi:hypothetical protein